MKPRQGIILEVTPALESLSHCAMMSPTFPDSFLLGLPSLFTPITLASIGIVEIVRRVSSRVSSRNDKESRVIVSNMGRAFFLRTTGSTGKSENETCSEPTEILSREQAKIGNQTKPYLSLLSGHLGVPNQQ